MTHDIPTYDWSVLDGVTYTPSVSVRSSRPNIFEIAGFPRRETVSSNVLAYFFDPAQNHGLSGLFVKALIDILNERSSTPHRFAYSDADDGDVYVQTEVSEGTKTRNRVDIVIHTPHLSIAIENKVDATLYNDLPDYLKKVRNVAGDHGNTDGTVCVVVLHANSLQLADFPDQIQGLRENNDVFSVSYDDLFQRVLDTVGGRLLDADPRAVDVLEQYIDNFSAERNETNMQESNELIRQFTDQVSGKEQAVYNLLNSLGDYVTGCDQKLEEVQQRFVALYDNDRAEGVTGSEPRVACQDLGVWKGLQRKALNGGVHYMSSYYIQNFTLAGQEPGVHFEFFNSIDWIINGECQVDTALQLRIKAWLIGGKINKAVVGLPFEEILHGVTMLDTADGLATALKKRCDCMLSDFWGIPMDQFAGDIRQ